jgi:hypothetical protein
MVNLKTAHKRFLKFQATAREPGLTAVLIVQVLMIFVAVPLVSMGVLPEVVVALLFFVLVIAILVVSSRSYYVSALVMIAVVLTPFGAFVQADHPSFLTECLSAGGRLLGISALSYVIMRAVFANGRVTLHRVQGAVVLYLNFALFFSILFRFLETVAPGALHGLTQAATQSTSGEFIYFSFTTLTTAGYGDIIPVHPLARGLSNLEAIIGQLYPATLLARLVSLELEHRRERERRRERNTSRSEK